MWEWTECSGGDVGEPYTKVMVPVDLTVDMGLGELTEVDVFLRRERSFGQCHV
jgi:hypothetical protein